MLGAYTNDDAGLHCGHEAEGTPKFCPECGTTLRPRDACGQCGAKMGAAAKFCPDCGAKRG